MNVRHGRDRLCVVWLSEVWKVVYRVYGFFIGALGTP